LRARHAAKIRACIAANRLNIRVVQRGNTAEKKYGKSLADASTTTGSGRESRESVSSDSDSAAARASPA
jgi:hypothetical protein